MNIFVRIIVRISLSIAHVFASKAPNAAFLFYRKEKGRWRKMKILNSRTLYFSTMYSDLQLQFGWLTHVTLFMTSWWVGHRDSFHQMSMLGVAPGVELWRSCQKKVVRGRQWVDTKIPELALSQDYWILENLPDPIRILWDCNCCNGQTTHKRLVILWFLVRLLEYLRHGGDCAINFEGLIELGFHNYAVLPF